MNLKGESDDELVRHAGNASPGGMLGPDGPQAELMRRLMVSIKGLNNSTTRYSRILIWLTATMTIAVVVQIILFFFCFLK